MEFSKKRTRVDKDSSDSSTNNTPPNNTNTRGSKNKPKVVTRNAQKGKDKDKEKDKEKEQKDQKKPKKPGAKPSKKKPNLNIEASINTPKTDELLGKNVEQNNYFAHLAKPSYV